MLWRKNTIRKNGNLNDPKECVTEEGTVRLQAISGAERERNQLL